MTFDAGTIVGLAFGLVFVGFIAWAEIHSRRQRRKKDEGEAASRGGKDQGGREPSKKG